MISSFDKKNLSEDPFALEMETHCEEDYACPIVKGNSFGIFSIPGTNVRSIERKRDPCASAVGSKISAQKNLP